MCAGFVAANPYALLDHQRSATGCRSRPRPRARRAASSGSRTPPGWRYYLGTCLWGFGWLPSLFALGGAVGLLARHRRLGLLLAPAPMLLFLYLGDQSRFFARWMLPVYPIGCLLAAWGVPVALATRAARPAGARGRRARRAVLAQGLVFSVHNDVVLARADTRMLVRDWMVENIPAGRKVVVEPVLPDQWATDAGHPRRHPHRHPLEQVAHVALVRRQRHAITCGACRVVKLEDYERTTRPGARRLLRARRLLLGRDGLDAVRPRLRGPADVPHAIRYYDELEAGRPRLPRPARTGAETCRSRSTTRSTTTRSPTTALGRSRRLPPARLRPMRRGSPSPPGS